MDNVEENVPSIESKKSIKKKKFSISFLKSKMKPTKQEFKFRQTQLQANDVAETSLKFFKCTKCQRNYKGTINEGRKISKHPFLKVLMCKKCCDYYGDGNFSLDSDGEDKYCRWCGEGGTILLCSQCIYGFCTVCLKKHLGAQYLTEVQKDDSWICLFCNPKPLWHLRFISFFAEKVSYTRKKSLMTQVEESNKSEHDLTPEKNIEEKNAGDDATADSLLSKSPACANSEISGTEVTSTVSELRKDSGDIEDDQTTEIFSSPDLISSTPVPSNRNKRKVKYLLSSSDSSSSESRSNKRDHNKPIKKLKLSSSCSENQSSKSDYSKLNNEASEKLESTIRSLEYQLAYGMNFCGKLLKRLSNLNHASAKENLIEECKKIKLFLSMLSSHLDKYSKSVELVEKSLSENSTISQTLYVNTNENSSPYTDILKFLNCVTNQVKGCKEKNVSFSEFLESGIFNNETVCNNENTVNLSDSQTKEKSGDNTGEGTPDKNSEFQVLEKSSQSFFRTEENDKTTAEENSIEEINTNLDRMNELIENLVVPKNKNELLSILAVLENA